MPSQQPPIGQEVLPAQPMSGTLQLEGCALYHEVTGEGEALVLIHASVADCTMWDGQFGEFGRSYRVIRYDVRGFGRSKTGDVEFSHRRDLYDLLKHLDVERAHLIGASRGAQIAVEFALERPEMVSALVLVAGGLPGLPGEPAEAEAALLAEIDAAEEAEDWDRVAEMDVRIWADGPLQSEGRAPEALRERMRRMCLNNYTTHATQGRPRPLDPRASMRLSEIKAPTLVMVGDYDASPIHTMCDRLARSITEARKAIIRGTAHMASMEKPEEFNKIVLDFLGNLNK